MSIRNPAIGSALFFLAAPGVVAGLFPFLITGWRSGMDASFALTLIGALIIAPCAWLLIDCFIHFAKSGGTPAPIAETPRLVIEAHTGGCATRCTLPSSASSLAKR